MLLISPPVMLVPGSKTSIDFGQVSKGRCREGVFVRRESSYVRRESHVKATNKVRNPRVAGGGSSICVPFSLVSRRIIRGCVAPRMTTPHLLRVRAGRRVPGPVSEKHSIRGMRDLATIYPSPQLAEVQVFSVGTMPLNIPLS